MADIGGGRRHYYRLLACRILRNPVLAGLTGLVIGLVISLVISAAGGLNPDSAARASGPCAGPYLAP